MKAEREALSRRKFVKIALIFLTASCTKRTPFESAATLPVELEGAEQWKEGCILSPVIDPSLIVGKFQLPHHPGVDFEEKFKDYPVYSSISGTAVFANYAPNIYGKSVIVETPLGNNRFVRILYAHLEKISVLEGEEVRQGNQIGVMGSTGKSAGPHLHFEIQITNWPFNEVLFDALLGLTSATIEKMDEFEKLYGKGHVEWIDPLEIIQETCK